jgi:hypothetical protein
MRVGNKTKHRISSKICRSDARITSPKGACLNIPHRVGFEGWAWYRRLSASFRKSLLSLLYARLSRGCTCEKLVALALKELAV